MMIQRIAAILLALSAIQESVPAPKPGFSGEFKQALVSDQDVPVMMLVFRGEPGNDAPPQILQVPVKDGKFSSDRPLPEGKLSIQTVPPCVKIQDMTLLFPGNPGPADMDALGTTLKSVNWYFEKTKEGLSVQYHSNTKVESVDKTRSVGVGVRPLGLLASLRDRIGGVQLGCPKAEEEGRP